MPVYSRAIINNMIFSVITIILSALVFAACHSLLACLNIKDIAYRHNISPRRYRLIYVIIAILLSSIWLAYIHQLPDQSLYSIQGTGQWLCYGTQALGILLFYASLQPIDTPAFLGLRNFSTDREPFIEQGIYRYIRHPMYSSIILLMIAMPRQSINSLTLYLLIGIYFIIGSRWEEQRMINEHPEYIDYRNRVPAFIPVRRRKLS